MTDLTYIDFAPDDQPVPAAAPVPAEYRAESDSLIEQGTDAWFKLRAGKITASRIKDMMAGGKGISRDKYMTQLAIERMTGQPVRGGFENDATRHGNACESEALELYGFQHDVELTRLAFVTHPRLDFAGCSPDTLVGVDGMAQVKCPEPHTFVGYQLNRQVPRDYNLQMQWEMACAGRQWSDFVAYDPDQIPRLRLLVIRVWRDDALIATLEQEAVRFNDEIIELIGRLERL